MEKAKLVIWDLDDTLWQGTLAEGDNVTLFAQRAEAIKTLNTRGVVNAICSKNDYQTAKAKLASLGLWDEFVFSQIAFEPKGALVQRIITNMQLRAPDVVFIDDHPANLAEVAFMNDGIRVWDARDAKTDMRLQDLLDTYKEVKKSRIEEYRILERKHEDAQNLGQSGASETFLDTCDIQICLVERADNLPYSGRIEELINRTNQMNYLSTRVETGSMVERIIDSGRNHSICVFVKDKYGYYGLVGFANVRFKKLEHYCFSCRIMNMGIENALSAYLLKAYPDIELPQAAPAKETPWIKMHVSQLDLLADWGGIDNDKPPTEHDDIHIMINCQSGAIVHYMGLEGVQWDNWPRTFRVGNLLRMPEHRFARVSCYGVFTEYPYVSQVLEPGSPAYISYAKSIQAYAKAIPQDGISFIVLPPEQLTDDHVLKIPATQVAMLNNLWREQARLSDRMHIIEIPQATNIPEQVKDPRHFTPEHLMQLAQYLKIRILDFKAQSVQTRQQAV